MKIKKIGMLASLVIAGAAFCGVANAIPAQWDDYIDFRPDRLVTVVNPVIFAHDITDGANGFVVGSDTVSNYSLTFNLYDDNDRAFEVALFSQPGDLLSETWYNLSGTETAGWTVEGRWMLQDTGHLLVAISALAGDFYLGSSYLSVNGNRSVPEPATLALFGAALLGFGLIRRKRIDA
jgi:hypothetical protein